MTMIKVFYDGKCGLCMREIAYYRRRDKASAIDWVDVNKRVDELQQLNMPLATALKHMHVQLEDGRLVKGMDAFIAIWQRIPGWHGAARFAGITPIKACLDLCYKAFAWLRFKSYRHCRISESTSA